MKFQPRRAAATLPALVLAGLLASAGATSAAPGDVEPREGGFKSHLDSVRAGFDSTSWTDRNNDADPTRITLENCSVDEGSSRAVVVLRLWQERAFLPDVNHGEKTFQCKNAGDREGWGRVPAADYHFEVVSVNGRTDLHVSTRPDGVKVRY